MLYAPLHKLPVAATPWRPATARWATTPRPAAKRWTTRRAEAATATAGWPRTTTTTGWAAAIAGPVTAGWATAVAGPLAAGWAAAKGWATATKLRAVAEGRATTGWRAASPCAPPLLRWWLLQRQADRPQQAVNLAQAEGPVFTTLQVAEGQCPHPDADQAAH